MRSELLYHLGLLHHAELRQYGDGLQVHAQSPQDLHNSEVDMHSSRNERSIPVGSKQGGYSHSSQAWRCIPILAHSREVYIHSGKAGGCVSIPAQQVYIHSSKAGRCVLVPAKLESALHGIRFQQVGSSRCMTLNDCSSKLGSMKDLGHRFKWVRSANDCSNAVTKQVL